MYLFACNLSVALPYSQIIKEIIFHPTHLSALFVALLLTFTFDFLVFYRRNKQVNAHIKELLQQIHLTREQRQKQQLRANEVSDHSDKLKSFISDKLIEYMDFDEKFIHFKGIASEVRHNGVISYDKINSALNKAIEQQKYLAIYEGERVAVDAEQDQESTQDNQQASMALYDYQTAKEAIAYLWDLLDLSTAENMSLYIGKKLVEFEEIYYQSQLNPSEHGNPAESFGVNPTFYPIQSILMTMKMFSEDDEIKYLLADSKINESLLTSAFLLENESFRLSLEPTSSIFGNPNHLVLLLENIIKNAQFFNHKARYKQKTDRVIIQLSQLVNSTENGEETYARISVYNRGKQISHEDMQSIFKLGYTTRRKADANGRGLGLYFVEQIVKGYQGTIKAINIENADREYQLTIGLASKEQFKFSITSKEMDGRILVSLSEHDQADEYDHEYTKEIKIQKDIPIESIHLEANNAVLLSTQDIKPNQSHSWLDDQSGDDQLTGPQWFISLSNIKKKHHLIFRGLDRSGVRFDIELPLVEE